MSMTSPWISGLVLIGLFVLVYGGSFLKDLRKKKALNLFRTDPTSLLVDVRTAGEYRDGAVKGAINVPVESIKKAERKLGSKDRPILVYCATGSRARAGVMALRAMGYTQVFNLGSLDSARRFVEV